MESPCISAYALGLYFSKLHRVPEKKQATIIFHINFAICWDIFTIFEATCSGIIAGWCNLLHTHHQCQAFTWRDVTHDVIQAVARRAHRHQISYHLTYGRSPDLNPVHYSFWSIMQEKVCEYRWVETSPSSGVGGAGPQTWSLQILRSGDAVSVRVTRVWQLGGSILTNICVQFTCRPLCYLLNSWPM